MQCKTVQYSTVQYSTINQHIHTHTHTCTHRFVSGPPITLYCILELRTVLYHTVVCSIPYGTATILFSIQFNSIIKVVVQRVGTLLHTFIVRIQNRTSERYTITTNERTNDLCPLRRHSPRPYSTHTSNDRHRNNNNT